MPFDNPIGINDPSGDYTYDAATWRRAQSGLIVHDVDPLAPRTGVLNGLSVSVSGMTVQAAPGQAVVGDTVGAMGGYIVVLPAAESETLEARDATFSRTDLVCVVVDDPESSGTERGARLLVVTGTPSVSPSAPATPEGALALARVTVPPSGALSVVDDRRWTAMAGGTIRCTSTTRPSGGSLMPGQSIFETDTSKFAVWTGSTWTVAAEGTDTGWTDVTILAGFAAQGTDTPQVRRYGGRIEMRGGWSNTGLSTGATFNVGTIPSGFRPSGRNAISRCATSNGASAATMFVNAGTGNVQIRTNSALSGYYLVPSGFYWYV